MARKRHFEADGSVRGIVTGRVLPLFYVLEDCVQEASSLLKYRAACFAAGGESSFDFDQDADKVSAIVSELGRVGVLLPEDVDRLASMVLAGSSMSDEGLAALRSVAEAILLQRASRFAVAMVAVHWKLIVWRMPHVAVLAVDAAVRRAAALAVVTQVRTLPPLVGRIGGGRQGVGDGLLAKVGRRREIEDPDAMLERAERAIVASRAVIRRIKRRKVDAARKGTAAGKTGLRMRSR